MTTLVSPGTRKDAAQSFLRLAASANPREAFARYTGSRVVHHNPHFPGDAESLIAGMEENAAKNPEKALVIHHVLEDGDPVAVHSHVRLKEDSPNQHRMF